MKIKVNYKVIISLLIMIGTLLILSSNVYAETIDIPEKIEINQSEYEARRDEFAQVEAKLNELYPTEEGYTVNAGVGAWSIEGFYNVQGNISKNGTSVNVKIPVEYNNTATEKNTEFENYITNLELKKSEYVVGSSMFEWDIFMDLIEETYKKQITGENVKVVVNVSAAGSDGTINVSTSETATIAIFENDKLYRIEEVPYQTFIPTIKISTAQYDESVVKAELVKNFEEVLANQEYRIVEGAFTQFDNINLGMSDTYTIYIGDRNYGMFHLEYTPVEIVENQDTVNDIIVVSNTGVIPSDTKIVSEKLENGSTFETVKSLFPADSKLNIFDINLLSNNTKIQPNGKVLIRIPLTENFDSNNLKVYRITESGESVEYAVKITEINGIKYIEFETDHFSIYVVSNNSIEITNTPVEGEKDDTPKTGSIIEENYIYMVLAIVLVGGVVIAKNIKARK